MAEKGCQINANYNILECDRLHTNQIIYENIQTIDLITNIHNHTINNNSQIINLICADAGLNNNKTITLPQPSIGKNIRIIFDNEVYFPNNNLTIRHENTTIVNGSYIEHTINIVAAGVANIVNYNTFGDLRNRAGVGGYVNAVNELELHTNSDTIIQGSYLEFICLRDNNYTMYGNIMIF